MEDLLSWAERFIATPSVSCDGDRAIAELAAELLELAGLEQRALMAQLQRQFPDGLGVNLLG